MLIRRCAVLMFEPREQVGLDIEALLAGQAAVTTTINWVALAAHLDAPVAVSAEERELLGAMQSSAWSSVDQDEEALRSLLPGLLQSGLVVSDAEEGAAFLAADEAVRAAHWWPLSALAHRMGRWQGVDSVSEMREQGMVTAIDLHGRFGPPPAATSERSGDSIALPRVAPDAIDALLATRSTCRNFDRSRSVSLASAAHILQRTVMAQAVVQPADDMQFLKKFVPSGGGLHPLETYVVARDVEGLDRGVYHYHAVRHSLTPVATTAQDLDAALLKVLAGQDWFADAPVHLIQIARFQRSFWKYRRHPKAYRAILLDAGHLSQQLALCATEAGLAAYVTAAINEVDIEALLGLDGLTESPVIMCGFGWRGGEQVTSEFDPQERIWKGQRAIGRS